MGTLSFLLLRTRVDTFYKQNLSSHRESRKILSWRLLRWILVPLIILLTLTTVIYFFTWAMEIRPKPIISDNITEELRLSGVKSGITLEIEDRNKTDLLLEEVSFVDRLISTFQNKSLVFNSSIPENKVEFSSRSQGETGYLGRKMPQSHKYGEYQSLQLMDDRTTSHHVSVSPTLPSILPKGIPKPTVSARNYVDSKCHSPQLSMCRGVIPWDLTTVPNLPGINTMSTLKNALPYFELVIESGCSHRAKQFFCGLLEPECRPVGQPVTPPCRTLCKMVAEDCSDFIIESLDLSKVFKCDNYPDADDSCINLAKYTNCLANEMSCGDGLCIPNKWKCNGFQDCENGIDELNCTTCNHNQFLCHDKKHCIPAAWKCNGESDCFDESDENDCHDEKDIVMHSHSSPCPIGELRCIDGRCIALKQICDGNKDCLDRADEENCGPLP